MYRSSLLLTGVLLTSLSGCDTNKGPLNPDFGNSVQYNMSAQIINPRIPTPGTQAPEMEGTRAFKAFDRYQRNDVQELQRESTSGKSGSTGAKN